MLRLYCGICHSFPSEISIVRTNSGEFHYNYGCELDLESGAVALELAEELLEMEGHTRGRDREGHNIATPFHIYTNHYHKKIKKNDYPN